jgi:Flp pilus assembly protein TadG
MKRAQSGQAMVEWAAVAFVLVLFALGLVALGQIIGQYMAVRSAASQAAFAAARAPSESAAVQIGQEAAREAMQGSQVESFVVRIDAGNFERGSTVTARAEGDLSLAAFPIVRQILGQRFHLEWQASALIEPYRSRAP